MFSGLVLNSSLFLFFLSLHFFDSLYSTWSNRRLVSCLKLSKTEQPNNDVPATQTYHRENKILIIRYLAFSGNKPSEWLFVDCFQICEGRKTEGSGKKKQNKKPWCRNENQQQAQPTYDAEYRIRTLPTWYKANTLIAALTKLPQLPQVPFPHFPRQKNNNNWPFDTSTTTTRFICTVN